MNNLNEIEKVKEELTKIKLFIKGYNELPEGLRENVTSSETIGKLSDRVIILTGYIEYIEFANKLENLYEQRRNTKGQDAEALDKEIEEFTKDNEKFFGLQFFNVLSNLNPDVYNDVKEKYPVKVTRPETFYKSLDKKPKWDPRLTEEQILDAYARDIYEPVGQEYEMFLRELGLDPIKDDSKDEEPVKVNEDEEKLEWDPRLTEEQILDAYARDIYEPKGPEYEQFLRELGLEPIVKTNEGKTENKEPVKDEDNGFELKPISGLIDKPEYMTPEQVFEQVMGFPFDPEKYYIGEEGSYDDGYDNPISQLQFFEKVPKKAETDDKKQLPALIVDPFDYIKKRKPKPNPTPNPLPPDPQPTPIKKDPVPNPQPDPQPKPVPPIPQPEPKPQRKSAKSLERILYNLTLDENGEVMDISKAARKNISGCKVNVTKSFLSRCSHGNLFYNILGITSSPIPMFVQTIKRWFNVGYKLTHPTAARNYEKIVENLANLSDEDLEKIKNEYYGRKQQQFRSYVAINPLIDNRIAQYIEEKNEPLREYIFKLQKEIMRRYKLVNDKAQELQAAKDPNEKAKIEAEINALAKDSAVNIKMLLEKKEELARNLEGGPGIHTANENAKASDNNSADYGKIFAHKKTTGESAGFNEEIAAVSDDLEDYLLNGDDLDALLAFGDKELLLYESTSYKQNFTGKYSTGDYSWDIMPKRMDYGNDPLLGYVFTTISTIGIAKGILSEIHNAGVRKEIAEANQANATVNDQITQSNQANIAANQQNVATMDSIHQTGRQLEGRAGDFTQGVQHMTKDSVVSNRAAGEYNAGDATNWSFNATYHTMDKASHSSVHDLYDQANLAFADISKGVQNGTLSPAQALEEAQKALATVETAKMGTYQAFLETMKTYVPAHPQHDYVPIQDYMDKIVNDPNTINSMVDGMVESVKAGESLQQAILEVYQPISAAVQVLPDNIQSFIFPLVTQACITGYMNRIAKKAIKDTNVRDYNEEMAKYYEDLLGRNEVELEEDSEARSR